MLNYIGDTGYDAKSLVKDKAKYNNTGLTLIAGVAAFFFLIYACGSISLAILNSTFFGVVGGLILVLGGAIWQNWHLDEFTFTKL